MKITFENLLYKFHIDELSESLRELADFQWRNGHILSPMIAPLMARRDLCLRSRPLETYK